MIKGILGRKMNMKRIVLAAIVCSGVIVGCAKTPRETRHDEMRMLKRRIGRLTAILADCDAELAKDGKYVVRSGDTLVAIAKRNGLEWKELAKMNPEVLNGYPRTWRPGLVLVIRKENPNQPSDATSQ